MIIVKLNLNENTNKIILEILVNTLMNCFYARKTGLKAQSLRIVWPTLNGKNRL